MFVEFVSWWYGRGWLEAWKTAGSWVKKVQLTFSIPLLVRTLFSPWKQIISMPGRSIEAKFRAVIDNLVSRTIGFFVRLFALLAAGVIMLFAAIIGFVVAILWPTIPIIFLYCAFRSITG